jgi:putative transposase
MKLTAKVKLKPTNAQADSLKRTLEKANAACNYISQVAWDTHTFGKFQVQKLVYDYVRKTFNLTAQLVIRCIAKVTDAYKLDKKTQRTFKPLGSIAYDARILSWKMDKDEVSIWTVDGRQKMNFVCHARAKELLLGVRGESDLCFIDDEFYLFISCETEEESPKDVDDFLGVDLGIKNIASDSDGNQYSGSRVNALRKRHAELRSKLQAKGTQSARRLLKKRSRKEKRFAKDVNHQISKAIVLRAKDTNRGIALEELGGIRERVTVKKAQRRQHNAWAFSDLRLKIEYKAKLHGIPVILVDPRNTSRTCTACGCIDKANRKSQSVFLCVSCGYFANADTNAAVNIRIRGRALVNAPNVPTVDVDFYSIASGTSQRLKSLVIDKRIK